MLDSVWKDIEIFDISINSIILPFTESFLDAVIFTDPLLVSFDVALSLAFGLTLGFRNEVDFFEEVFSTGLEFRLSFTSFLPFPSWK